MKFVKNMFGWKSKSKRKGITPVIAIVLLLMMTVAAAGMAYVWIMSLQEGIAADTDADIARLQDQKNTRLEIVSVYNTSAGEMNFIIKNAGTRVFTPTEAGNIMIYIDGQMKTLPVACSTAISSQGTTCTYNTAGTQYPTVPGRNGAVEIKVEPPFGTGDVYVCSIPDTGTHKTC